MENLQRQLAITAKAMALVGAAATGLFTIALVLWQVYSWFTVGTWNSVTVAELLDHVQPHLPATYETASAPGRNIVLAGRQGVLAWMLELPAIIPLIAMWVLLVQ